MNEPEDLHRTRRRKVACPDIYRVDRLPPNSQEAEQSVLACCLQYPVCVSEAVVSLGDKGVECFYDLRHQSIFTALLEMNNAAHGIDPVLLCEWLKKKQLLGEVGGIAYISALADIGVTAGMLGYYLAIIHEHWTRRRIIHTCTTLVSQVYENPDVEALVDEAERDVLSIRSNQLNGKPHSISDDVKAAINTIEDYHQRQGHLLGISSGFVDFDKLTGGLIAGEMIVIAGRPSTGKTSLAMNMVEHITMEQKEPVGVFSLEMTRKQLVMRMLCSRARVNHRNIRDGFLAERDFPKLTGAAGKLSKAPLHIEDPSGLSIMQLRATARRMWQQFGIKLFVIDYLQLLQASKGGRRIDKRQEEIAEVSAGIKALAKELGVPVIVLAQMNRDFDKDKNRAPRLSDLRESGSIEQDGDTIGFLYRPKRGDDEPDPADQECCATNLLIAKQRNGPSEVDVCLTFLKPYTRFESAARVSDDDVPQDTFDYRPTHPDA